jgi:anti-sigma-K factor RskA
MITEHQEEQACFYVLGLLPEHEITIFEKEIESHPELARLVASLNNATVALAKSAPPAELPAAAKKRLMDAIAQNAEKVVPFESKRRWGWIPWAAAAGLAIGLFAQYTKLQMNKVALSSSESSLQSKTTEVKSLQDKLTNTEAALAMAQREKSEQLALAQKTQADLLTKVKTLEQKNTLAQAKIAVMGSKLKSRPQAVAVSLWDQENQNGLLVVENLPVLQSGRDYQLWVIDPAVAAPVSAGVFQVDEKGKMRLSFKPSAAVSNATTFAVTEEKAGGVASPTLQQMVVIGGL